MKLDGQEKDKTIVWSNHEGTKCIILNSNE
jgi:hypothetical protein